MSFDPQELQQLLLETFILEAAEQLALLDEQLAGDFPDLESCRRIAHTLKGSARAVGMRSAERSALELEHYYRSLEERGSTEASAKQVEAWIEHIRYWSEESHAKALFEKQPAALLWNTDPAQAALYASLLGREGYLVHTVSSLEELGQGMDQALPPAMLCIMEEDADLLTQIFELVLAHPEWSHAPTLVFSPVDELPQTMEIFHPAASPAPGALMAGLETVREATA